MKINQKMIVDLNTKLQTLPPHKILEWAYDTYKDKVSFATSLGAEDQVILDIMQKNRLSISVFTIDTGRLFNETYELIEKTENYYGIRIITYFPESSNIEAMVRDNSINLFYKEIESRKLCCNIRKVKPLDRALNGMQCWITGLRKDQSELRGQQNIIGWDKERDILKINPIINWTETQLWDYIDKNNIPYNSLHDKGYPSIGCSCCTRAVKKGENNRTGRWWWESNSHKECGIHVIDGKVIRTNN